MAKNWVTNSAKEKNIVVCIAGMAGTGKSTLAKKLAEKYQLKYYSGGDALKELARKEGHTSINNGWWESPEGLSFLAKREEDLKYDKAVDQRLIKYAQKGNVLLDSWTMPWLLESGFKIWLIASIEKRAERIAERDKISPEKALHLLKEKEAITKTIYKRLYGFLLGEDFEPFDLVLDTDNLNADEVFKVLCEVMDNIVLKGNNQ